MSKNGVQQLRKVSLVYCDIGGSSGGLRAWISSEQFINFAKENPNVEFLVEKRRGRHPYIRGIYLNGREVIHDCKNDTLGEVAEKLQRLRDSWGIKNRKFGTGKLGKGVSVQGQWTPLLWQFSKAQQRDFLPGCNPIPLEPKKE